MAKLILNQTSTILNPWDEFAIEAALQIAEIVWWRSYRNFCWNTGLSNWAASCLSNGMPAGDSISSKTIRINCQVWIWQKHSPPRSTNLEGADLILFGKQSADYEYGLLAALFAQVHNTRLVPFVSAVDNINEENNTITLVHQGHAEKQQVTAPLPLVLTINKDFSEPRFPSFMGTRKAKKAEIPQWNRSDLGLKSPELVAAGLELKPDTQKTFSWIDGTNPETAAAEIKSILQKEGLL